MSKDSSIKVFAENVGDTNPRPVNNIPVWIENVSAIGGGGGGDFDPTYMSAQIDDKLNKNAVGFYKDYYGTYYVSGISGNKVSAYRTYSAYTARNAYTAQIAYTAHNAEKAQTAYYDGNSNSLTDTYYSVQNLSSFVQNNSANWGGSGPTGDSGKVLFHKHYYYDPYSTYDNNFVSGASELYFNCAVNNNEQPQEIIILNNGNEWGRVYWNQVSSDGSMTYYSGSVGRLPTNLEFELNSNGSYVYCYVSANGNRINLLDFSNVMCLTSTNVKFNVQGNNITGRIEAHNQGSITPLTSFTGGLTDFSTNGFDRYYWSIFEESYGNNWNYDISAEMGGAGGSTVTSGDVLPPGPTGTGNTYALCWNDANGLFWDMR